MCMLCQCPVQERGCGGPEGWIGVDLRAGKEKSWVF